MRRALLDNSIRTKAATSFTRNVPAPVGGWNTRDALAEMDPLDAPILDNWFPRAGQVISRGGALNYSTGMTGSAQATFQYSPTSGTKKLYSSSNAGVYDVTAGGAVGAVAKVATNGYINTVNFANSAGTSFLWCCNGTDVPFYFDGAAWTDTVITGIATPANLTFPTVFKHRIFAVEKNTMNVWYLPVDSIQGVASKLPFGNFLKLGGSIISIGSWTLDAGEGPDDLFVVVSSEGQIAIYKGTDPSSASSWAIVGVFYVGIPLGRRCMFQLGGDVGIMTENGAFLLSKLLQAGTVNYVTALSNKIQNTWAAVVKQQGVTTLGWDAVVYPQFDALVINVPSVASFGAQQFVMNTVTGAWCSFSGWDLLSMVVFNAQLYYTTAAGNLVKAWDPSNALVSDNGNDIVTTAHCAYNYFGSKTMLKKVELFRLLLTYNGSIQVSWNVSADYQSVGLSSLTLRSTSALGSLWDAILWNTHYWASVAALFKYWRSVAHVPGYALALWLQTATKDSNLTWAGTDYILHGGSAM